MCKFINRESTYYGLLNDVRNVSIFLVYEGRDLKLKWSEDKIQVLDSSGHPFVLQTLTDSNHPKPGKGRDSGTLVPVRSFL